MYETSEDGSGREEGGRQGGVIKHRCVPWRTAFFYCALSADCGGRGGFHLMGSIDGKLQETEQRNRVWNRRLRKDNERVKGHFLLPQFWAAWGKIDFPGNIKQLRVAVSYASPENTLMGASARVPFIPPRSRKCRLLTFFPCPFAVTAVQKIFHGLLSVLQTRVWYFPLSPRCTQQQRGSCVWGTGSGSPGVTKKSSSVRLISEET